MVDDQVYSAPVIAEPIKGGRIQITLGTLRPFAAIVEGAQRLTLVVRHAMIGTRLEKLSEDPVTMKKSD